MAERKYFNFESIILVDLTIEKEGYSPSKYGKTSNKFIWASCRFCGKPSRLRKGQFTKNNSACHKECRYKEQSIAGSPFKDAKVREKTRQTNLERYGTENANQNKDIAAKISKGRRKAQKKIEKTNLERYGVSNPFQSEEIKEKIKQTHQESYGVDHHMKDDTVQEKTRNTLQDRYGVGNIRQHEPFKQAAMETRTQNIAEDPDGKYVLINILRSEAFWGELSKKNMPLTEVCQKFNLPYQSVASTLSRDEFKERFQKTYSFPKQQQQNEIKEFISSYGFKVVFNDRKTVDFELDVYVPEKKFAIEFNGSYWHSESCLDVATARKKHVSKTKICNEKGINLLHVFEHTWQQRKLQIMNFIKSILGVNANKIAGRNCEVSNDPCPDFFDRNHIQGKTPRVEKYFNLTYNGKVVASMTASKHHRQNVDGIVLSRLCFEDDTDVQGGASKLFKRFKEWAHSEGYDKIISWSDSSWTQGGIYSVLGFDLEQESAPDYFYWDVRNCRYVSKQSQQKKKTRCPEGMTEREWCIERNLHRIWDCGKKKWTYVL